MSALHVPAAMHSATAGLAAVIAYHDAPFFSGVLATIAAIFALAAAVKVWAR